MHRLENALDKDMICVGDKREHCRESEILSALIIGKILHYHKLPLFHIFLKLETCQDYVGNSGKRDSSLQCRRIVRRPIVLLYCYIIIIVLLYC